MAKVSVSGPGEPLGDPESVEWVRVDPEEGHFGNSRVWPVKVLMWHGGGYKRDDCWIQIDDDAVLELNSYL